MDVTVGLQWIALSFLFLIGSIWSEDNARFGYIVTAFMAAFFWWLGWITFAYLAAVIPVVMMIAVISYLRSHLKYKFGVFGSSTGLVWKILMFIIVMQFAIILINGLAIFNTQYAPDPSNTFTQYSISNAESVFGSFTSGTGAADLVVMTLTFGWMLMSIVWSMLVGLITLYPSLITIFHVPPMIAAVISAAMYVLIGLELFMIIFKPGRSAEP